MASPVPPSALGRSGFSSVGLKTSILELSRGERARWEQNRSSWPRLLTPTDYKGIDSRVQGRDHKKLDDEEPRWCRTWTRLYEAMREEEWEELRWLHRCDRSRLRLLRLQSWMSWELLSGAVVKEQEEIFARLHGRYRDCLALAYLWTKYSAFEGDRGVPDLETVHKRLESFGEEEKPSFAEREERVRKLTAGR